MLYYYKIGILSKDVQENQVVEAQKRDFVRRQSLQMSEVSCSGDTSRSFSEKVGRTLSWASDRVSGKSFTESPLLYGYVFIIIILIYLINYIYL
jgi:hypothetical protein